uniref:hypothetical protein n=1 Tax=Treponema endosymbiont of Eucomonympha sp. TaxID=1580831 RepID=UPI001EE6E03F
SKTNCLAPLPVPLLTLPLQRRPGRSGSLLCRAQVLLICRGSVVAKTPSRFEGSQSVLMFLPLFYMTAMCRSAVFAVAFALSAIAESDYRNVGLRLLEAMLNGGTVGYVADIMSEISENMATE